MTTAAKKASGPSGHKPPAYVTFTQQLITAEALRWATDEFGQDYIVGGSLHLDEVHPQLHVLVTPVTSDGRLSQKDFFKGPGDLKRQHKELRLRMEAAGYDVEHKVTARSTEHLGSAEFKTTADRARKTAALFAVAEADSEKAWGPVAGPWVRIGTKLRGRAFQVA